jgi:hypothetical protein
MNNFVPGESGGNFNKFIKYVGPPLTVATFTQTSAHNLSVRKHNAFSRRIQTDEAFLKGLLSCQEYAEIQIKSNFVPVEVTMEKITSHYSKLPKAQQNQQPQYDFKKNGTTIVFEQNPIDKFLGIGNVKLVSKNVNSSNGSSPFLSITNSSLDRETIYKECQDAEVVETQLSNFNQMGAITSTPQRSEITVGYNSYTSFDFWSSPAGTCLTCAGWTVFVYGGIALFNKLQTGRFFQKPSTEIEILAAYQKHELSLKQATFLLTRNFDMLLEEAVQFLKDDFSKVPNK